MTLDAARRFLSLPRVALVGASRDPKDFSRRMLDALVEAGIDVVPVNPGAEEIGGRRCFPRVSAVQPPVQGALLMVAPQAAEGVATDALAAGVRHLWFHRGGGAGAASPAALARCAEAGAEVVTDLCPFMVLPRAGWFHRLHGHFRVRSLARQAQQASAR